MTRRSPGEGSVQRDDQRWKAVLRYTDPASGRSRRAVRRASTKTGAVAALNELRANLATRGALSDGLMTVEQACTRYVAVKSGQGLSSSSLRSIEWMTGIISDAIGRRRIADLSVTDCDQFLSLAAAGVGDRRPVGRSHLRRIRSTLVAVISNAEREGLVVRNVAQFAVLPANRADAPNERIALSPAELDDLLTMTDGKAVGAIVALCGLSALRPAEARALKWSDIDLTSATASITKQLDERGVPTSPKTAMSSRKIELVGQTADCLRRWRSVQREQRMRAGEAWSDLDLVATTERGTALDKDNLRRALRRETQKAKIRQIVPYELRHTALTHLSNQGHTNWELADYGGTSTRMIEQTYRHRTEGTIRLRANEPPGRHHIGHQ